MFLQDFLEIHEHERGVVMSLMRSHNLEINVFFSGESSPIGEQQILAKLKLASKPQPTRWPNCPDFMNYRSNAFPFTIDLFNGAYLSNIFSITNYTFQMDRLIFSPRISESSIKSPTYSPILLKQHCVLGHISPINIYEQLLMRTHFTNNIKK